MGDSPDPVLLLAFYFTPGTETGAARPSRFYRYLSRFGFEPHVITASRQHPERPLPDVTHVPGYVEPDRRSLLGWVEIVLRRFVFPHDNGVVWIVLTAWRALRSWPTRGYTALVSSAPPITVHLAALLLRRIKGIRWVADFRDPYLANPFRPTQTWLTRRVDRWIERSVFRYADALIANTETVSVLWKRNYPQYSAKMHVLPNGFDPEEPVELAPSLASRPYRVLAHVGTMYTVRHPGLVLAALERLADAGRIDQSAVRVRLVGLVVLDSLTVDRQLWDRMRDAGCLEYDGKNVPKAEANAAAAGADYLLLLDPQQPGANLQVPAKLYDYLRIGRPILAVTSRESPLEAILARAGVPYACLYIDDTEEEIDAKLSRFLTLPSDAVRASDWFWEEFDGSRQTGRLAAIIRDVLDS